jgi:hypothetical protein
MQQVLHITHVHTCIYTYACMCIYFSGWPWPLTSELLALTFDLWIFWSCLNFWPWPLTYKLLVLTFEPLALTLNNMWLEIYSAKPHGYSIRSKVKVNHDWKHSRNHVVNHIWFKVKIQGKPWAIPTPFYYIYVCKNI